MVSWRRRTGYFLGFFVASLVVYVAGYHWGMIVFEGESPSVYHSLQVVVETFTTTGYGSDAPWTSPEMNVFVTVMDLTGVLFFFMSLPLFIVPLVEEALSTSPPTAVDLRDHVVICGFTGRGETFIEELTAWDTDYVVVEPDRETAADLHGDGYTVVHGDPESPEDLQAACTSSALAVVADATDESNASIALTCREIDPEVHVVAFAEDPDHAEYIRYAGADEVLTPRHLLGESLAEKVTAAASSELRDVVQLGEAMDVAEVAVEADSELAGERLADSGIRERTGANIIGTWRDGVFEPQPGPDDVLEAGTILLVAGRHDQLEAVNDLASGDPGRDPHGQVVVVGHGEVGRTVSGALATAGVRYTVVDVADVPGTDVVGDGREEETLREAGVPDARAVILALPDDTTTIFATLVLEELAPDVEVVARAVDPDNVRKLYRAGADYVLSLSTVSGRMLASVVLDEENVAPDRPVDVIRCGAPRLVGMTLGEADVRSRTGTTVIAIQRDGELLADLDPDVRIEAGDELVVAGSDDGINRFTEIARA